MTDIRTRLAEVIDQFVDNCWQQIFDGEDLADVLLALPGIAIIELPDDISDADLEICYGKGIAERLGLFIRDLCPSDTHTPRGARLFAAALLAAANMAEDSK
jgi:hypothetical protein